MGRRPVLSLFEELHFHLAPSGAKFRKKNQRPPPRSTPHGQAGQSQSATLATSRSPRSKLTAQPSPESAATPESVLNRKERGAAQRRVAHGSATDSARLARGPRDASENFEEFITDEDGRQGRHHLAHAAQQLRETHPLTAGVAAMLVFTAWSMLLPASPMELSISYIFGFWRGFTIVYFGKLCTCLLAYILSRSCLRSWAHEAFSRHEVLRAFESECVSRPWRVAFLLRAVYIPLPVKNYGGGALGLPPLPWSVATLIVEVPDTYFTAALGSAARSVTELLHGGGEHGSTSWTTVFIMGAQCVLLAVQAM